MSDDEGHFYHFKKLTSDETKIHCLSKSNNTVALENQSCSIKITKRRGTQANIQ